MVSKKLICLTRGLLSNRLKSLASAWVLSKQINRSLYVEWPYHEQVLDLDMIFMSNFNKFEFSDRFFPSDLSGNAIFYSNIETIKIYEPRLLSLVKSTKFREINKFENFDSNENNMYIFLSDFYPNIKAEKLQEFFYHNKFGFLLERELLSFFEIHKLNENTISVHMRGNDFPCKEINLLWYYYKMKTKVGDNAFFLATDDDSFANFIKARFPKCILSNFQDQFELSKGDHNLKNNLNGLFDQLILSHTNLKIFDRYSTFAHIALLFSKKMVFKNPNVNFFSKIRAGFKYQINRLIKLFWRLG